MSACIPTYMLASSLIGGGMNWSQAVLTIFLGNLIVLLPMVLNAHAGTKYGIPFPVFCRAAFGTRGANVPAMLRALVACGWFGIQTWIGGNADLQNPRRVLSRARARRAAAGAGHHARRSSRASCSSGRSTCGSSTAASIPSALLLAIKAPLLIVLGLALLGWAYHAAGGFGPMLVAAVGVRSRASRRRAGSGNSSCPR